MIVVAFPFSLKPFRYVHELLCSYARPTQSCYWLEDAQTKHVELYFEFIVIKFEWYLSYLLENIMLMLDFGFLLLNLNDLTTNSTGLPQVVESYMFYMSAFCTEKTRIQTTQIVRLVSWIDNCDVIDRCKQQVGCEQKTCFLAV